MKRSSKIVLSGLGLFLLAAMVVAPTPSHSSGSAPVTVVNTPLPVQGTIGVNNLPAVQSVSGTVSVGNTPNVNVANTPAVSVTNTPSVTVSGTASVSNAVDQGNNPIPLLVSPQGQPYMDSCQSNTSLHFASCDFHVVPAGQRLLIQFISLESLAAGGTVYEASTGGVLNGSSISIFLPLSNGITGDDGYLRQMAAAPITSYVDANFATGCAVTATGSSTAVAVRCALSGYLVPTQ